MGAVRVSRSSGMAFGIALRGVAVSIEQWFSRSAGRYLDRGDDAGAGLFEDCGIGASGQFGVGLTCLSCGERVRASRFGAGWWEQD